MVDPLHLHCTRALIFSTHPNTLIEPHPYLSSTNNAPPRSTNPFPQSIVQDLPQTLQQNSPIEPTLPSHNLPNPSMERENIEQEIQNLQTFHQNVQEAIQNAQYVQDNLIPPTSITHVQLPPPFYPISTSTQTPLFGAPFPPPSIFGPLDQSLRLEQPPKPQDHTCPHLLKVVQAEGFGSGSKNAWRREWCTEKGCLGRGGDRVERGRQLNMSNGGRRNEMDWVGCEKEEWVQWVNFVEVFVVGLEQWIEEMDLSILVNGGIVRASVVSIVTMGLSCDGCGEVSFEVMEEALEESFGLLKFWGFTSFNWRELVHVGNGIKSVVVNGRTIWVDTSSLIWRGESSHDQQDRIHRAMDKGD
ncbi:hypothetical protein Tco_0039802 [Tanacetum coccineum]